MKLNLVIGRSCIAAVLIVMQLLDPQRSLGQKKLTFKSIQEMKYKGWNKPLINSKGEFFHFDIIQYHDNPSKRDLEVMQFNSEGVMMNTMKTDMASAPFFEDGFEEIVQDAFIFKDELILMTTRFIKRAKYFTVIKNEPYSVHFWRINPSGKIVSMAEIDNVNPAFSSDKEITIEIAPSKRFFVCCTGSGMRYFVYDENWELVLDKSIGDESVDLKEAHTQLDNLIIDDEGIVAFSVLFVGKIKPDIFVRRDEDAGWFAGTIQAKNGEVHAFGLNNYVRATKYNRCNSKLFELSPNEFGFINEAQDYIVFDKHTAQVLRSTQLELKESIDKSLTGPELFYEIDDALVLPDKRVAMIVAVMSIAHLYNDYSYQLIILRPDGTLEMSKQLSGVKHFVNDDRNILFAYSRSGILHIHIKCDTQEAEMIKKNTPNAKRLNDYDEKKVSDYVIKFDPSNGKSELETCNYLSGTDARLSYIELTKSKEYLVLVFDSFKSVRYKYAKL